ncbi:exonuclease [Nautilia profundicola AmH]|uniref:Exonuclease n=1 Tax=Nautilia profundicola (strain ATCC BAA-1463 / DSM 18972 / AmH) TaxID=598659 RepID=B9L9V9_NAUPA|nr:3'-5' exonuclease [Nautilia profundicola]ACM92591.1 exonuclease [Nautilia profundicola AmH]
MFGKFFKELEKKKLKDKNFEFLFDEYEGDEVVVVDTETTGLDRKKDEIISIGAVIVKNNRVLLSRKFHIFVKPSKELSIESIKIHKITPDMLKNALEPETAIKMFLNFIKNRPLVGYYLEFDVAMLNKLTKRYLGIKLPNRQIEVSAVYYDKKIGLIPQKHIDLRFDSIMKDLNLPIIGKHDALNDAIMTALMYIKLQNCKKI